MRAAFLSVGCKTNQYEIEAVKEEAAALGYEIVGYDQKADVYVINTCVVTAEAARKSKQMIRRADSDQSRICVMGCYSQLNPDEAKTLGNVRVVTGTQNRRAVIEYLSELAGKRNVYKQDDFTDCFEDMGISGFGDKTRAYVKIEDGCDEFCSYCIIPYARGRVRSRRFDEIINEAKRLADHGYQELVITGINICKYEHEDRMLPDVIEGISKLDGIRRIRLSSIYPDHITKEFIDRIKLTEKLCPHFHVSLQSGSDRVLKAMNRKYTASMAFVNLSYAAQSFDDMLFTADVITGFPDESDEDHTKTCTFIRLLPFYHTHVFKYSKRQGTAAFGMKGQISEEVKRERSRQLIELSLNNKKRIIKDKTGKTGSCLFEKVDEQRTGDHRGHLANYMDIIASGKITNDRIVPVRITGYENGAARAEIINT